MIYVENDFYSNFNAVSKSNDEMAMQSILVDQISNLIAYNREEVLDLLRKSEIKLPPKPKNKDIVKAIVQNLKTNKKLVIGLAYLIAKNNDLLQEQTKRGRPQEMKSSFEDKTETTTTTDKKEKKPVDWNRTLDAVNVVGGSISVFADTLTGVKQSSLEQQLNSATQSKSPEDLAREQAEKLEADKKARRKRNTKIAVGVLLLAGVGVGVYFAWKKGWFAKKSAPIEA